MKNRMICLISLFVLSLSLLADSVAVAGDFPQKPIEINMSWPPGGSSDTQCRMLIENAKEIFGQPVVIVDKSGAAGTKSAMATKIARPDGYTLMWASGSQLTLTPQQLKVGYSREDYKPVIGTTLEHTLVVTSKDSGIKSLDDLKKLDSVTVGTPGANSGPAAALHMLMAAMGVKAEFVPFKGSNESSTAALGGHVTIADSRTSIVDSMEDLRVLCILSSKQSDLLPGIPTAMDLGYDVILESYNGLYAPKNTPDEVVEILGKGFRKMLYRKEFTDFLKNLKIDISGAGSQQLQKKVNSDYDIFKIYFDSQK